MQKEFRNSQSINIYFHKVAPPQLSPPCWPLLAPFGAPSPSPPAASAPRAPGRRWGRGAPSRQRRGSAPPLPAARVPPGACASLSLSLARSRRLSPSVGGLSAPLRSRGPGSRPPVPEQEDTGPGGTDMAWGGGTPLKARRGEVVSPATGGRTAAPRGLRISTRAGSGGGHAPAPPAPPPAPLRVGAQLGGDFGGSWTRQWGREVGPWQVISQSADQSADQS